MSFICVKTKNHVYINSFPLSLALKQRLCQLGNGLFGFVDWKEYQVEIETKLYQLLEEVPHHAPAYPTLTFFVM